MKKDGGMGGPLMKGGGEHGGMMMGDKNDGMKDGDTMKHHEMMANRMDMMQMNDGADDAARSRNESMPAK